MTGKSVQKSSVRVPTPEDIWRLFEKGAREQNELREAQKQAEKRANRAEVERKRIEQRATAERKRIEQRAEKEWQELRELQKRTEEAQQNTSKGLDRLEAEGERLQKSINEASGKFDNQWGRFMEALVETDLPRTLRKRGIEVWRTQPRLKFIDPRDRERCGEFDIVAYNGLQVVPTEAKTTLRIKHVKHFIENLRDFKVFFPEYKDKIIYGAIAYMGAAKGAEQYAVEQGLFIIKAPSTKTKITSIRNAKNFKPKSF